MDHMIEKTLENLKKNHFITKYFNSKEEAMEDILKEIPADASIGIGGSVTIDQLGLYERLIYRGNAVYWHHRCEPYEKKTVLKNAAVSDIYLSSTNAVTRDGTLINIDGAGNRVANMFWGHHKIIIIAGINKITFNYDEGVKRIKTVACPQNAERLNLDVPCRYSGKCEDCNSPQRMCRILLTLERQPMNGNVHVYLINEELGY